MTDALTAFAASKTVGTFGWRCQCCEALCNIQLHADCWSLEEVPCPECGTNQPLWPTSQVDSMSRHNEG